MAAINAVLLSTYELGRQPFGLASPAAWLRARGATVTCLDLSIQRIDDEAVSAADLIAWYVPMHTATRIAASFITRVKRLNPGAHLCFYGLYAPVNEAYLRALGADTILGGEFETGLAALVAELSASAPAAAVNQAQPVISLARQDFVVPDRSGLPDLARYAHVAMPDGTTRVVGYTEASRGCKHRCRHCPVVPVYGGRFFVVPVDVVLADIERQAAAGAQHITFGDPDFFNGPKHALRIVRALHERFPELTYDVTIKIEHLLAQADQLAVLRDTGCLFVTSAVEAVDDRILEIFDKRHTRQDFINSVALFRENGLTLNPTFVTFSPWITLQGYQDLLRTIRDLDLIANVSPIQYAIRLLIPAGSRLLELPFVQEFVGDFDAASLAYPWTHPDPRVDRLHADILNLVSAAGETSRPEMFARVWDLTAAAIGDTGSAELTLAAVSGRAQEPIPHLSEPWYC